ncbi:reverse transcriptase [Cucumis melo var. makuwa]|uniref:Reverse transcriptase n=1 Tax=Cucumis melo var. makuwa TaxID=1194695 RepID=A0A5D3DZ41_CUCMM|nr:reverse transcriptase [Cucumis melo var. makuwa]
MVTPTAPPTMVHGSEPTQARGTIGLDNTNLCVEGDIVDLTENGRIDMLVSENNGVASSDETLIETQACTRSCTKYPMYSFLSYSNLSSESKAFTACLDSAIIPKYTHMAMEIPEWEDCHHGRNGNS